MMSKETGGSAFPQLTNHCGVTLSEDGMMLRDYFAAKAMAAVITAIMPQECHRWTSSDFAREGYEIADAMLAERVK